MLLQIISGATYFRPTPLTRKYRTSLNFMSKALLEISMTNSIQHGIENSKRALQDGHSYIFNRVNESSPRALASVFSAQSKV